MGWLVGSWRWGKYGFCPTGVGIPLSSSDARSRWWGKYENTPPVGEIAIPFIIHCSSITKNERTQQTTQPSRDRATIQTTVVVVALLNSWNRKIIGGVVFFVFVFCFGDMMSLLQGAMHHHHCIVVVPLRLERVYVLCVLSSHLFWTPGLWTYQPGSRRRKVTQDFSSTFLLRCLP